MTPVKAESKLVAFLVIIKVIVPPYCGTPSLSHQCPVVAVVVVVVEGVVEAVAVAVLVIEAVLVVVDVNVDVEVEVDVLQDVVIKAATIKKLKLNQTNLFFISCLHLD